MQGLFSGLDVDEVPLDRIPEDFHQLVKDHDDLVRQLKEFKESREAFQRRGWFGFVMLCNLTASIPISSN